MIGQLIDQTLFSIPVHYTRIDCAVQYSQNRPYNMWPDRRRGSGEVLGPDTGTAKMIPSLYAFSPAASMSEAGHMSLRTHSHSIVFEFRRSCRQDYHHACNPKIEMHSTHTMSSVTRRSLVSMIFVPLLAEMILKPPQSANAEVFEYAAYKQDGGSEPIFRVDIPNDFFKSKRPLTNGTIFVAGSLKTVREASISFRSHLYDHPLNQRILHRPRSSRCRSSRSRSSSPTSASCPPGTSPPGRPSAAPRPSQTSSPPTATATPSSAAASPPRWTRRPWRSPAAPSPSAPSPQSPSSARTSCSRRRASPSSAASRAPAPTCAATAPPSSSGRARSSRTGTPAPTACSAPSRTRSSSPDPARADPLARRPRRGPPGAPPSTAGPTRAARHFKMWRGARLSGRLP